MTQVITTIHKVGEVSQPTNANRPSITQIEANPGTEISRHASPSLDRANKSRQVIRL